MYDVHTLVRDLYPLLRAAPSGNAIALRRTGGFAAQRGSEEEAGVLVLARAPRPALLFSLCRCRFLNPIMRASVITRHIGSKSRRRPELPRRMGGII